VELKCYSEGANIKEEGNDNKVETKEKLVSKGT